MRILMFSMTPLFANQSMGGAQKQLKKVAVHLAEQGHEVTILCTRRSDASQPFAWHPRCQIIPLYRFKQPFPEPYETPPYNIAAAIQDTADYLAQADVYYSHDGGLIFPYVVQDKPSVVSLRSILFSETLQSGFLFQGDALILPSQHTAEAWQATAGRFFPALSERLHVIPNGLDFAVYRPTPAGDLATRLGLDPSRYAYVLYPHRPEEAKGIRQTIAVMDALVHEHGLSHVRALVPQWIDSAHSASVRAYYDDLRADIATRGLSGHFIFHPWVTDDEMPEYYSLGAVTLALGSYVETFGNTPYESLACGTPVVAARVAAYRAMLPPSLMVEYGDTPAAAALAAGYIRAQTRTAPDVLAWLQAGFAQSDMVARYADVIVNARKLPPMPYRPRPLTAYARLRLASWCELTGQGIYHDFLASYAQDEALIALLRQHPQGFGWGDAPPERIMAWLRDGYCVPSDL